MSRHTRALRSIAKSSRAPSNFNPPRLTNFPARAAISMRASCGKRVPALLTRVPSTETSPARIIACAFARESARPRSTSSVSRRFAVDFALIFNQRAARQLRATNHEVLGDFFQPGCGIAVRCELRDGFAGQIVRDFVRALEAMNGGIGGFLLGYVFAGSLAQSFGRFFDVENVVGDLKGPANGVAEPP